MLLFSSVLSLNLSLSFIPHILTGNLFFELVLEYVKILLFSLYKSEDAKYERPGVTISSLDSFLKRAPPSTGCNCGKCEPTLIGFPSAGDRTVLPGSQKGSFPFKGTDFLGQS